MSSQHQSPNVKTFCNFEPQIWPEMITSHNAKRACFKGSRTSCDVINCWLFWAKFWPEKIAPRDGCFLLSQLHRPPNMRSGKTDPVHFKKGFSTRGFSKTDVAFLRQFLFLRTSVIDAPWGNRSRRKTDRLSSTKQRCSVPDKR